MKFLAPFLIAGLALGLTAVAGAAPVVVANAWSRPADDMGVVYATLRNQSATPDALVGATCPLAQHAELHESTTAAAPAGGMGTMGGMPMGGVVSMHPVTSIPVPAHGQTALQPGGYHIMLIGLHAPLAQGMTFPLRLHFMKAGWITTQVHVRAMD